MHRNILILEDVAFFMEILRAAEATVRRPLEVIDSVHGIRVEYGLHDDEMQGALTFAQARELNAVKAAKAAEHGMGVRNNKLEVSRKDFHQKLPFDLGNSFDQIFAVVREEKELSGFGICGEFDVVCPAAHGLHIPY